MGMRSQNLSQELKPRPHVLRHPQALEPKGSVANPAWLCLSEGSALRSEQTGSQWEVKAQTAILSFMWHVEDTLKGLVSKASVLYSQC